MTTLSPIHVETLARADLDRASATEILSAQGFGETLCQHMTEAEIAAVRAVWLADDMPSTGTFRSTLVLISKNA